MNKDLLKKAIKNLSIRDVILDDIEFHVSENYDPSFPQYEDLLVQYRHGVKYFQEKTYENPSDGSEHRMLIAKFECAFRVLPPDEDADELDNSEDLEKKILVQLTSEFAAYYSMKEGIDNECIKEFMKYNVGYHVWPYWREFATSMASRIRIPSFTVPLYVIPE